MTDRLLLFDFDGVIADSLAQFTDSFTAACDHCNLEKTLKNQPFLDLFDTNLWQALTAAGLTEAELKHFMNHLRAELDNAMQTVKPFSGLPDALAVLGAVHPLYIVTSSVSVVVEHFLDIHKIQGVRGVLGAEKTTSKVEKILAASKQHPGSDIYYVGDTAGDMLEAKQAAAIAVAVAWGWHDQYRLHSAGADHIAQTPQQLVNLLSLDGKIVAS